MAQSSKKHNINGEYKSLVKQTCKDRIPARRVFSVLLAVFRYYVLQVAVSWPLCTLKPCYLPI